MKRGESRFKGAFLVHLPKHGLESIKHKAFRQIRGKIEELCLRALIRDMEVLLTSFFPDLFRDVARDRPVQELPVNFWKDTNIQTW